MLKFLYGYSALFLCVYMHFRRCCTHFCFCCKCCMGMQHVHHVACNMLHIFSIVAHSCNINYRHSLQYILDSKLPPIGVYSICIPFNNLQEWRSTRRRYQLGASSSAAARRARKLFLLCQKIGKTIGCKIA